MEFGPCTETIGVENFILKKLLIKIVNYGLWYMLFITYILFDCYMYVYGIQLTCVT